MLDGNDGRRIFLCGPGQPDAIASVHMGSSLEQSQAIAEPDEVYYYAFLDHIEDEDARAGIPQVNEAVVIPDLGGFAATPDVAAEQAYDQGEEADRHNVAVVARFDCIRVEAFNGNLDEIRAFYQQERQEDINGDHELAKTYTHHPSQATTHLAVLNRFVAAVGDDFRIAYVSFVDTAPNLRRFLRMFRERNWFALGFANTGVPALLYAHGANESGDPTNTVRLRSVYDLSHRRRNNLRHVFSLDFAADAFFPPPGRAGPAPTPITPQLPAQIRDDVFQTVFALRREEPTLRTSLTQMLASTFKLRLFAILVRRKYNAALNRIARSAIHFVDV